MPRNIRKNIFALLNVGLVTISWGVMTATVILAFIFQGYFVPGVLTPYRPPEEYIYVAYLLIAAVAIISGIMLREISVAVGAFFASTLVAATIEYFVLILPSTFGQAGPGLLLQLSLAPLSDMAIIIVFSSIFPVALILGFIGSLIGAAIGESYLT